jgi:2-oxo-3-hexenedioate decarboxylase
MGSALSAPRSEHDVMADLGAMAMRLDQAARDATPIPQLGEDLSLEDAYRVQHMSIKRRLLRGERQIGIKMGFTSRAKMVQMGISDMIWGRLTDAMIIEEGALLSAARYIHPRVEPELAFLLKRDLVGAVTPLQAMDAVEAIAPALELIDSRYADFRFSLTDVIADNASSSGFVTGSWHRPDLDFSNLGLVLSVNDRPVQIGSTAGILGHPLRALVAAARFAAAAEEPLRAGSIVMAGGATAAEALLSGDFVELEMQNLGRVAFGMTA